MAEFDTLDLQMGCEMGRAGATALSYTFTLCHVFCCVCWLLRDVSPRGPRVATLMHVAVNLIATAADHIQQCNYKHNCTPPHAAV